MHFFGNKPIVLSYQILIEFHILISEHGFLLHQAPLLNLVIVFVNQQSNYISHFLLIYIQIYVNLFK